MKMTDKKVSFRSFSAALLIFAVLGFAGCGEDYTRAKFSQLVMDKTEAEVKTAVGEPNLIKGDQWFYFRRTFNAKNENKADYKATLTFALDKATGQRTVHGVEFSTSSQ